MEAAMQQTIPIQVEPDLDTLEKFAEPSIDDPVSLAAKAVKSYTDLFAGIHFIGAIHASKEIDQILPALLAAQAEIATVERDATAKATDTRTYTYATITAVLNAIKPALNNHGIVIVGGASCKAVVRHEVVVDKRSGNVTEGDFNRGLVTVTTAFFHAASSQYLATTLELMVADPYSKAAGGGITYGRRYGVTTLGAVGTADDDGDSSQPHGTDEPIRRREQPSLPTDRDKAMKLMHMELKKTLSAASTSAEKIPIDTAAGIKRALILGITGGEKSHASELDVPEIHKVIKRLQVTREGTVVWIQNNGPGGWREMLAKYEDGSEFPVKQPPAKDYQADARNKAKSAIEAIVAQAKPTSAECADAMFRATVSRLTGGRHEWYDTLELDEAIALGDIKPADQQGTIIWLKQGGWKEPDNAQKPQDSASEAGDQSKPN